MRRMIVKRSLVIAALVTAAGCTHRGHEGAAASPKAAPPSASATDCGIAANAKALADQPGFRLAPEYVRLTLTEAQRLAERSRLALRVVGHDGHCPPVTADARKDRVSVYVVGDRIRAAAIY